MSIMMNPRYGFDPKLPFAATRAFAELQAARRRTPAPVPEAPPRRSIRTLCARLAVRLSKETPAKPTNGVRHRI